MRSNTFAISSSFACVPRFFFFVVVPERSRGSVIHTKSRAITRLINRNVSQREINPARAWEWSLALLLHVAIETPSSEFPPFYRRTSPRMWRQKQISSQLCLQLLRFLPHGIKKTQNSERKKKLHTRNHQYAARPAMHVRPRTGTSPNRRNAYPTFPCLPGTNQMIRTESNRSFKPHTQAAFYLLFFTRP